jgi:ATP-dependent Clp protease, protease subunit
MFMQQNPTQPSTLPQGEHLADTMEAAILGHRRLFVSRSIDAQFAEETIRKIWYLDYSDPKGPVTLVISSPGGSVDAGFAIWDQLKMMRFPLTTVVTGLAASMGSVLALAAPKGRRFASPKARFMIHQPAIHIGVEGQATDLEIQAREILKTKEQLVGLYCEATGKPKEEIEKAIDRDMWMSAQEALEFGLIDRIVSSYEEVVG